MPKTAIFPPSAGPTLAPYSPGASADGIVYVSGTLALDELATSSMSATPPSRPSTCSSRSRR